MICTVLISIASASVQSFLGARLSKRSRCGSSFPGFGQGSRRKACLERY